MTEVASSAEAVTLDPLGKQGFILHEDTRVTGEGFGYSSGWLIYPFVQLAVEGDLLAVFRNANTRTNRERNYSCLEVAEFLEFDQRYSIDAIKANSKVVILNTWDLDRPRNDKMIELVKEAVKQHREDDDGKVLTISIVGPLQQQIGPEPCVLSWFRERSLRWRDPKDTGLKVAMHLRRGDTANSTGESSDRWAFKYGLSVYQGILSWLQTNFPVVLSVTVDVFTEANFSKDEENKLATQYPTIKVHRGTSSTMFSDLRAMAIADIFITSASYFSAIAGYLSQPENVMVMGTNEAKGVYESYFSVHKKHGMQAYNIDDPLLASALTKLLERKGLTSQSETGTGGYTA